MLLLFALVGLLAFVLARWAVTRRPHWISLTLVLLVLVPTAWFELRWRAAENAFSAVTRMLVPAAEGAACQRMLATWTYGGLEWGHVQFDAAGRPETVAWLSYDACRHLRDWYFSDKSEPTLDQVRAVEILAHEAEHLRGQRSEAVAECDALQRTEEAAIALGATPEQARALVLTYWSAIYPRLWSEYRTQDCREDGPLDRTPGDGVWP